MKSGSHSLPTADSPLRYTVSLLYQVHLALETDTDCRRFCVILGWITNKPLSLLMDPFQSMVSDYCGSLVTYANTIYQVLYIAGMDVANQPNLFN